MKKFLPHILIILFCLTVFFAGVKSAYAASLFDVLSDTKMAVAQLAGYAVWILFYLPAAAVLWLAGQIFNFSLFLSLNSGDLGKEIITMGWGISRDVANLFFIFILLYISIATILRLSGYGAKELLARLVIVALLVNFSLVFSQAVIDASNILALEFYNKIKVDKTTTIKIEGSQGSPQDLSAVFMSGFSPQKLFSSQEFEKALKNTGPIDILINTVIKFILAATISLMAAFILLAAAGLFVIRTVILWLLMILSPIAFISMILPATRSMASRWWSSLFKQAFFAPAFLFFYYLVAQMIASNFFEKMTVTSGSDVTGLTATLQASLGTFMQFSVLGILLVACIVVAQEMGAHGANTAMALGKSGAKMATGAAAGFTARNTIGRASQRMAASPTMQNIAAAFPRIGGAVLRTLQRGAQVGGREKITEQRAKTGMTLSPAGRAAYLTNADQQTQMAMMKQMPARERAEMLEKATPTQQTAIGNAMKNLPVEEREKTETLLKERAATTQLKTNLANAQANPDPHNKVPAQPRAKLQRVIQT
ncbi:MAG: hypothetical protein HZC14_01080 [Candidatus Niyogibacteria bacterium]|nr:hypothetical protein [Candidatus Niyogibacteria bacterium]